MPGEEALLKEFITVLHPPLLGQLVETVFKKMELAGEAGSLLKIDEEIGQSVVNAHRQWQSQFERAKDQKGQDLLFTKTEMDRLSREPQWQFDFSDISDEQFWSRAEDWILDALRAYAEHATNGQSMLRTLFSEDTVQGFAFVDLSRNKYDVLLMNPPFGASSTGAKSYLDQTYPRTKGDLLANFIERALAWLTTDGLVGAISSRAPFFLISFSDLRKAVLGVNGDVQLYADLGEGVLDATVETAAYTLSPTILASHGQSALFFRELVETDKEESLRSDIEEFKGGIVSARTFIIEPASFDLIEGTPYAYWVSSSTLKLLTRFPRIEGNFGNVRVGMQTGEDPRFLKLIWEVPPNAIGAPTGIEQRDSDTFVQMLRSQFIVNKRWAFYSKTDVASPWFSPLTLVVDWMHDGEYLKQRIRDRGYSPSKWVQSEALYFRPGFSYMLRSTRLVPYLVPSGVIPTAGRAQVYPKAGEEYQVLSTCASNIGSAVARFSGEKFAWPKFQASMVQNLPVSDLSKESVDALRERVDAQVNDRRQVISGYEPFQEFVIPAYLSQSEQSDTSWDLLTLVGRNVEERIAQSYGLSDKQLDELERDIREAIAMRAKLGDEKESPVEADDDSKDNSDDIAATIELIEQTPKQKAAGLLSYCLGCVFGRWDIRMALDKSLIAKLPAPFDPLPVCPPGMLVGPDGYPATSSRIVSEEWLKYRPNSGTIPDCAGVNSVTIDDRDYPLQIEWDGLLVDDSATDDKIPHAKDIVQRVHQVLSFLFGQRVEEIERELCETLAVRTLRDYFRRPSGFFEWHLDQYSKSHRKAPIYWPLSTESGSFTIWVYYHRLDDQTFYTAINLATVRIEDAEHHLATLQDKLKDVSGRNASDLREQLEAVQNYRDELVEFRNEVLRAAELPYRPNLNDGVLINAAPLHKTFRLRRWRGDLENCWAKLKNGDLDWAHLAYTIWPDQVRTKCRNDRSLAIAHGLEDICEVPSSEEKKTRKRSKSKP